MAVECSGFSIDADLTCIECGHNWQETFYEDHVANVEQQLDKVICPRCAFIKRG